MLSSTTKGHKCYAIGLPSIPLVETKIYSLVTIAKFTPKKIIHPKKCSCTNESEQYSPFQVCIIDSSYLFTNNTIILALIQFCCPTNKYEITKITYNSSINISPSPCLNNKRLWHGGQIKGCMPFTMLEYKRICHAGHIKRCMSFTMLE